MASHPGPVFDMARGVPRASLWTRCLDGKSTKQAHLNMLNSELKMKYTSNHVYEACQQCRCGHSGSR
jgi:hypothetical protein